MRMLRIVSVATFCVALLGCPNNEWHVKDAEDNALNWAHKMILDRDKDKPEAVNCSTEMTSGDSRVSCQYSYVNTKGDSVMKQLRCNVYPQQSCKMPDVVTTPPSN